MRNPKDLFSSHLCWYMSDEEFLKAIRVDIPKCHQRTIGRLSLSVYRKYLAPINILMYMDGIKEQTL